MNDVKYSLLFFCFSAVIDGSNTAAVGLPTIKISIVSVKLIAAVMRNVIVDIVERIRKNGVVINIFGRGRNELGTVCMKAVSCQMLVGSV